MNIQYQKSQSRDIVMIALIAGLYVVITFLTAPFAYGPLNFRIAEGLNFLALYNKRHIWAVTLGVFISNYFAFGPLDMIVGSLSTLVFLYFGRWVAEWVEKNYLEKNFSNKQTTLIKYGILAVIFSLSMITIALMIKALGYSGPLLPLYGGLVISEFIALIMGGFILYYISQKVDLTK